MRAARVSRRFRVLAAGVAVAASLVGTIAASASAGVAAPVRASATSATAISVRVSPPIIADGGTAELSARVTAKVAAPSGTVTFADAKGTLCAVKLAKGAAACRRAFAALGTYRITASYSGDAKHARSSGSAKLIVAQGETATTVTVSAAVAPAKAPTTFTAAVRASDGHPTGSVVFAIGASELCSGTLTDGRASCRGSYAIPGRYTVTATYAGDTFFYGSYGQRSWTVVPSVTSVQACVKVGTLSKNANVGVTLTLVTPGGDSTAQIVGAKHFWLFGYSNCPGIAWPGQQGWTLTFAHPVAASGLTAAASYLRVASTTQSAWHGRFELFTGAGATLTPILLTRPNMYYNQKSLADPCGDDESVNTYQFPLAAAPPGTCGTPVGLNP